MPLRYAPEDGLPGIAHDNNLMTKPIKPTAPMPKMLIFTESQSSSLSGLEASFSVLDACVSQDFIPIFTAHSTFHYSIIKVALSF
jgi:hypothetical protein